MNRRSTFAGGILAGAMGCMSLLGMAATAEPDPAGPETETCAVEAAPETTEAGPVGVSLRSERLAAARAAADSPRSCPKPTVGLKKDGNKIVVTTGDETQRDGIRVKPDEVYTSDADGKKDANGTYQSFEIAFPNFPTNLWDCKATAVFVPGGATLGTPRIVKVLLQLGLNENPPATFLVTVPTSTVGQQSIQINLTCTPKP